MKKLLTRLWTEDTGQDLTEYALLVVLIALAAVAAVSQFAKAIGGVFNNASASLATPT
jgi:pilus assembly protein Flp/PilA